LPIPSVVLPLVFDARCDPISISVKDRAGQPLYGGPPRR